MTIGVVSIQAIQHLSDIFAHPVASSKQED